MDIVLNSIVVFFLFIVALVWYIAKHRKFWEERNIRGPPPNFLTGNLFALFNYDYPPVFQIRDWTRKYGKLYGCQEGWRNVMITTDLNLIQEVFVKRFDSFHGRKTGAFSIDVDYEPNVHVFMARGYRWKRLRTLSNPTFSVSSMKKLKPIIEDSVLELVNLLDKKAEDDEAFNIHRYYQELTMDVISRIAMGQEESRLMKNEYIDDVIKIFAGVTNPFQLISLIIPVFAGIFRRIAMATAGLHNLRFPYLVEHVKRIVNERKKIREQMDPSVSIQKDFIDLFLDAEADIDLAPIEYDAKSTKVEKRLTKDEIVSQCVLFLLAGFDTTANSLAYASYCLAKHPECQRILQREIDEICDNEEVTYEQIQKLKYLDMVVKEALRLYPLAANVIARECLSTVTIEGVTIERGMFVQADVLSIHYDPKIWGEDVEDFKPERWNTNETRHPMSWVPFGIGQRICLGRRLADLEEKLALIHILRKFDIVECEQTEAKLKLRGIVTFAPDAVTVKLIHRSL